MDLNLRLAIHGEPVRKNFYEILSTLHRYFYSESHGITSKSPLLYVEVHTSVLLSQQEIC